MSDRLISADKAKKVLIEAYKGTKSEIIGKAFSELIDRVPTECDIENMCSQIRNAGAVNRNGMIHLTKVLDIVRKGGK